MAKNTLGRRYGDREVIVRQGEAGDCMFVIQEGEVEVLREESGKELVLAVLKEGDFFGEMAIFERQVRSATVRAKGEAFVLTIDKRTFLTRIQEDPTIAFNILKMMSSRIRLLDEQLSRAKSQ